MMTPGDEGIQKAFQQSVIRYELEQMEIGYCSSARGILVWRVSDTRYAVGKSIEVNGMTLSFEDAVYQLSD